METIQLPFLNCPICGAPMLLIMTFDSVPPDLPTETKGLCCSQLDCDCLTFASPTLEGALSMFNDYARRKTEICSFTIELPPITKKNHQEIRKRKKRTADGKLKEVNYIDQSKAYERYERAAAFYVPWPEKLGLPGPIDEPVNVKAVYYMGSHRRVDKTNLESALADVLVAAKLLADDNRDIIASTDGSIVLYDKEHPRTEVTITRRRGYGRWKE